MNLLGDFASIIQPSRVEKTLPRELRNGAVGPSSRRSPDRSAGPRVVSQFEHQRLIIYTNASSSAPK